MADLKDVRKILEEKRKEKRKRGSGAGTGDAGSRTEQKDSCINHRR